MRLLQIDRHTHCPKCGEAWEPEIPKDPWWYEARCENEACGYSIGWDDYGHSLIIHESKMEE